MSVFAPNYEQRLRADFEWALREGSMHFEQESGVQKTMRQIARRLDAIGVPYAIVGGMALFFHGYQRFTTDVDLLVTPDGLKLLHEKLDGLGYVPPFTGSKHLRDTDTGVKIEFLTTGDYPGDGKPKPIAFPDPAAVRVEANGLWFLSLPALIDLKLSSGMTNPLRGKDLADVQELIAARSLDESFADRLHPFVRDKFLEIVQLLRDNPQQPD
ncbi:MAG: hypothetical protein U0871_27170 [Gemmataceae bacterium]